MGRIPGDPEPEARIGKLLAMIEQPDRYAKRGKIPRGNADISLRRVNSGNGVVETSAVKDGGLEFWSNLPIRGA